jgi:hypothetical protein
MKRLRRKLKRVWNWLRGKRIRVVDPVRGRVRIRTGHNSATRSYGGQWCIVRFAIMNGLPPLPLCTRGPLDDPIAVLCVKRCHGPELELAKGWYQRRHGQLPVGHDLDLICVCDPGNEMELVMSYRPDEVFEIEHPWLGAQPGATFASYIGSWYGPGRLRETDNMDFEAFWEVRQGVPPLPRWGASW